MVRVILCLFVLAALFYSLFKYLINQSKQPSGFVGRSMMRIWNKAYLPMAQWALSVLSKKSYEYILDIRGWQWSIDCLSWPTFSK